LATTNCGVILGFRKLFESESLSQVANFSLDLVERMPNCPSYLIFDLGCKMRTYLKNNLNQDFSERCNSLSQKHWVVDRFHFAKHIKSDVDCQTFCDPNKFTDLQDVNTETCEQINSWLSRFKHTTKYMNYPRFIFFFLIFLMTEITLYLLKNFGLKMKVLTNIRIKNN